MKCPGIEDVPEQIARLPKDSRGFPIFFGIQGPKEGQHDFRLMNMANVRRCIKERLCGICGEKLGYWIAFVGGPKSCTTRVFSDPPFHVECAEFAFKVCPYILNRGWDRSMLPRANETLKDDPYGNFSRIRFHGIFVTRGYKMLILPAVLFKAHPAKEIRWPLGKPEEFPLSKEALMRVN